MSSRAFFYVLYVRLYIEASVFPFTLNDGPSHVSLAMTHGNVLRSVKPLYGEGNYEKRVHWHLRSILRRVGQTFEHQQTLRLENIGKYRAGCHFQEIGAMMENCRISELVHPRAIK